MSTLNFAAQKADWDRLYTEHVNNLPWISNPFPDELFKDFSNNFSSGDQILDYGCGNGRYHNILQAQEKSVTCLDISSKAIELCKIQNPQSFTICTNSPWNLNSNHYNGIFCWGVLHHIHPSSRLWFWKGLNRTLKKNGTMLIGGWSQKDKAFLLQKEALSPITQKLTWEIDSNINIICSDLGINVIDQGTFSFVESCTGKHREFSYYILRKI